MSFRIAICLYDEHITTFDIAQLLIGNPLEKKDLKDDLNEKAVLYLKRTNPGTPDWTELVKGFSNIAEEDTTTASSGAILFLNIENRIVACCFGSSVANINRDNIVTDFGLGVAFQRIKKRDIKTIESYILSTNPITTSRSPAIPTTQDNCNIDTYLENITELSGRFYSKAKSVTVKGKEFFSTPSPLTLKQIQELCTETIRDYQKSINNETYKKLTATRKVKEKKLINYLNEELCKKLNKRLEEVAIVDFEQHSDIGGYNFSPKGDIIPEITIKDFYKSLPRGHSVTTLYLKTKRITVFDKNGQDMEYWSLHKCLFCAFDLNIGSHILYKGNWYLIQNRFLDDLRDFIKEYEIESEILQIPQWDGMQDEGNYNLQAAKAINGQCWDKDLYNHQDYPYGIEFCDIAISNKIIHVKKSASSALNSHLLMQTAVSAHLLHFDAGIRKWIKEMSKEKFKKNLLLNSKNEFKNGTPEYVIVLLSSSKRKAYESLPFFSLISFNIVIRKIVQLGFSVKICKA